MKTEILCDPSKSMTKREYENFSKVFAYALYKILSDPETSFHWYLIAYGIRRIFGFNNIILPMAHRKFLGRYGDEKQLKEAMALLERQRS